MIPPGIPLRSVSSNSTREARILYVGSIFNRRHVLDLIRAFAPVARRHPDASLDIVALGGGCFQNARLLISLRDRLASRGLRVLTARRLPPNDGAISYGQAAIGAATLRARRR